MKRMGGWGRRVGRWRWARLPAVAVGLLLIERLLMNEVGLPLPLLRTLLDLGDAWSGPVASLLALMALLAEALAGYVVVVLALRSLCVLPGSVGRLAHRLAQLVTPVVLRRVLDLLVGGTMLAQAALVATPSAPSAHPGHPGDVVHLAPRDVPQLDSREVPQPPSTAASPRPAATAGTCPRGPVGPAPGAEPVPARVGAAWHRRTAVGGTEPARARPTPRRSAVPLPPWLGGGPSTPAPAHTVEAGDTLWDIAAAHLTPADRTVASTDRYWRQVYRANRSVIGADPGLIHPGTRLDLPPFRRDQR